MMVRAKRVGMKRLSVVVANHDYEQYVAMAIRSALDLRWDDIEVTVVDDGSNHGSRAVIEGFGDRVRVLLTENAWAWSPPASKLQFQVQRIFDPAR